MASSEIEFDVGQIWRDRSRKCDVGSMFVIQKVERYGDLYPNHTEPDELRITGYQVGFERCEPRSLHGNSMRWMYPYPVYIPEDPYFHFDKEDK